ncbi:DUF2905 domain-containing protein [Hyphomicrobium sulfonivorans]|uniref:DUF2905 domain-containing protein n=1 Tax=Hyphomicrobium sulfonivorans TaxID=121290 RepID=UPI0015700C22|nr:DUF2905 domain-containing protein [Hyphomicrobium sulfonivorans]MBI1649818.1 DUF2905 domain-containing protein [Hyphomicrobium sulfonivorans]NSL71733.1 DUF2905 domain-containing protein [Hyphomicrobium sulfonivorans]
MGKLLLVVGVLLVGFGLVWMLGERLGLGRLPGDFVIERGNIRIYIPLMTGLIVSAVLSLIFWLMKP